MKVYLTLLFLFFNYLTIANKKLLIILENEKLQYSNCALRFISNNDTIKLEKISPGYFNLQIKDTSKIEKYNNTLQILFENKIYPIRIFKEDFVCESININIHRWKDTRVKRSLRKRKFYYLYGYWVSNCFNSRYDGGEIFKFEQE